MSKFRRRLILVYHYILSKTGNSALFEALETHGDKHYFDKYYTDIELSKICGTLDFEKLLTSTSSLTSFESDGNNVLNYLKSIQDIDVSECNNITEVTIDSLPKLESFSLRTPSNISINNCSNFNSLNMTNTYNMESIELMNLPNNTSMKDIADLLYVSANVPTTITIVEPSEFKNDIENVFKVQTDGSTECVITVEYSGGIYQVEGNSVTIKPEESEIGNTYIITATSKYNSNISTTITKVVEELETSHYMILSEFDSMSVGDSVQVVIVNRNTQGNGGYYLGGGTTYTTDPSTAAKTRSNLFTISKISTDRYNILWNSKKTYLGGSASSSGMNSIFTSTAGEIALSTSSYFAADTAWDLLEGTDPNEDNKLFTIINTSISNTSRLNTQGDINKITYKAGTGGWSGWYIYKV